MYLNKFFVVETNTNLVNVISSTRELQTGIPISDEKGNKLGDSKKAATTAIGLTTFSRIGMASPGMSMFLKLVF